MGPLDGIRIVEIAGIGPGQFCGMLLADMGADVLRIDRPPTPGDGVGVPPRYNLMNRSRPTVVADLKSAEGVDLVLTLVGRADALFEGFRPGVMERFGLGPEECLGRNPRLVYGRMTGWGQDGPLAGRAGHDADYIALAGALGAIGRADEPPMVPLNLVGDFGGGGAYLALGIVAALLEAARSGRGQVVDAAMVDGTASLMTLFFGLRAADMWADRRESNFLDGSAPFYRAYRTSDGKDIVIAALENRFYRELLGVLGLHDVHPMAQYDRSAWPALTERLGQIFASETRDEWVRRFDGRDACFAPVLTLGEAPQHEHNIARGTYIEVDGVVQPAPAPRFSRTPGAVRHPPTDRPSRPGAPLLRAWGVDDSDVARLVAGGAVSE